MRVAQIMTRSVNSFKGEKLWQTMCVFIHAIVPRHVETVCCLYHQKKDYISVPYEPKDAEYLK